MCKSLKIFGEIFGQISVILGVADFFIPKLITLATTYQLSLTWCIKIAVEST